MMNLHQLQRSRRVFSAGWTNSKQSVRAIFYFYGNYSRCYDNEQSTLALVDVDVGGEEEERQEDRRETDRAEIESLRVATGRLEAAFF